MKLENQKAVLNVALNNDDKKNKKVVKTIAILNFDGVPIEEIIGMAIKSLKIKYQAQIRSEYSNYEEMKSELENETKEVSVSELLEKKTRVIDPFKQSMRLANKQQMNDDQLKALIGELKKQMKK